MKFSEEQKKEMIRPRYWSIFERSPDYVRLVSDYDDYRRLCRFNRWRIQSFASGYS